MALAVPSQPPPGEAGAMMLIAFDGYDAADPPVAPPQPARIRAANRNKTAILRMVSPLQHFGFVGNFAILSSSKNVTENFRFC
jgi:hypothetical protein